MLRIFVSAFIIRSLLASLLVSIPLGARGQDRLPGEPDVAALVQQLTSNDSSDYEKAKACQRLAISGDATAVTALAELLPDPQLSGYARTALERIPGAEAEEALVDALSTLRGNELAGVVHSIGQRGITSAAAQLETLAESDDAAVQSAARRALRQIESDQAPSPTDRSADAADEISEQDRTRMRNQLTSKSESKFRQGIASARQVGSRAAPLIAESLPGLAASRQVVALITLADLGNREVTDAVSALLESAEGEVAQRALEALIALGQFAGAETLPEVIDGHPELAPAVLPGLAELGSVPLDRAIAERLSSAASGQREERESILRGLASYAAARHLERATDPLLDLAQSTEGDLRDSLLLAAAATTSVDQLESVLRLIEELVGSLDPATESAVVERALVRMPPNRAADVMGEMMGELAPPRQQAMLQRLAFMGGDRSLEIVAEAARSPEESLVDAATQALGQWPTVEVADTLEQLVREMRPSRYRIRVIRGYLRVIRQFDMPVEERVRRASDLLEQSGRDQERELIREVLQQYR